MGVCLQPTPAMEPWYNVELSSSHAELIATGYRLAWYRLQEEDQNDYTDEERAAAWITLGPATFLTPAAPLTALLAALNQIVEHPGYAEWQAIDGKMTAAGVRAELRADGRLQITAPFYRYPSVRDGDHLGSVELLYSDVAPLRLTVMSLA